MTIISSPWQSQGLLSKHLCHSLIHYPLVKISLWRPDAQMVKNCASSHKTNNFDIFSEILILRGIQIKIASYGN